MESKIYLFFNQLYKYFKVSVWYWLYLMKGIVIYGIFPATCTLFAVINEMKTNDLDEPERLFSKHYKEYKKYKMVSFILFMTMILLYISLLYANYINNSVAVMLKVVVIYFGSMIIILFAYTIDYIVRINKNFKEGLIISFVRMIKNLFTSMWILIFSVALIILGIKNLVVLIFIVPFMYVLGIRLLLGEVIT